MKYFTYIFTRQDISPEQQIVQSAHATFQLGVNSQRVFTQKTAEGDVTMPYLVNEGIVAEETHFTLVGVRSLGALNAVISILEKFGYKYEAFFEPDLNNGEITSVAVYPISEYMKGPLEAFNLLKLK